ncbi:efflux RND transporter permease subunit [Leptospira langatensis]|uniref:Efflux RND transporter permease subunit n=1 Tax=Leptospira langatensis TaxID=2484983 RepID=A0A5F1ZUJ7_9LEPT|nr:efflux RND transporter permease subunit [Leptospira langatensis]TGK03180.1 efflux RND transporter permease subunit [Leptospira langatensis]TGL41936.1 efflux RND transporter permease subunit [Leptospira langatensis]
MNPENNVSKGFAGKLANLFVVSKLTPIFAIVSILVGILAVYLTPKEEEPQISVPMVDISVFSPEYSAKEMERKVTEVIERGVWGLEGVEYVYSASSDHQAMITVRFKVGEPLEPSLVKIHHKMMELRNVLPENVSSPSINSYTIDDVPFLALTFSSLERDDYSLRSLVAPLAKELSSTPDLSKVEILGGRKKALRVIANPARMKEFGIDFLQLAEGLKANSSSFPTGKNWSKEKEYDIEIDSSLKTVAQLRSVPIKQSWGRTISVGDVADVKEGPQERLHESLLFQKEGSTEGENAVTVVFSKRKGTDIESLSQIIRDRANTYRETLPKDIKYTVIRDYGMTAGAKSKELIEHLLIATISVSALIALWMGLRASFVVFIAIPVTLALTLSVYYFLGYTLNRVTLFALIFSIGILVDDAIVVVENIERHLQHSKGKEKVKSILAAVSEVGNPTILATFTVIAAILPMAFVRGLMGPYMKPIPVGASLAMILSLLVAFSVIPWVGLKVLHQEKRSENSHRVSKLDQGYLKIASWLLESKRNLGKMILLILFLFIAAASLVATKVVKVKMLPFDDKDEFQITLDFDPTTPLDRTVSQSKELANLLIQNEEIQTIQIFAGEPAPFSFSGMVKHTFLRRDDWKSDLHILLRDKGTRKKQSHEIIESLRPTLKDFDKRNGVLTKVLEIPPGPPVLSTLVIEIYGPSQEGRKQVASEILSIVKDQKDIVDVDSSLRELRPKINYPFDFQKGGLVGVPSSHLARNMGLFFQESSLFLLSNDENPEDVSVDLSVPNEMRSSRQPLSKWSVSSNISGSISPSAFVGKERISNARVLHRKNLKPLEYVTGEFSGEEEAPVYGILSLSSKIPYPTSTAEVPWNTDTPKLKWDGEWYITYEVFRDLGGAFAVVMVLIYILVLGWFQNYRLPIIIMAPIPISLIGIIPGHWITGAYFTATSMIGFIAGAGIIVRNSIILVDFIEAEIESGKPLRQAVLDAGVVRFRPMFLTAAAVIVGSSVMLFDPIFQGLAVSLIFGEIAATVLSRFAVPAFYYWFSSRR